MCEAKLSEKPQRASSPQTGEREALGNEEAAFGALTGAALLELAGLAQEGGDGPSVQRRDLGERGDAADRVQLGLLQEAAAGVGRRVAGERRRKIGQRQHVVRGRAER